MSASTSLLLTLTCIVSLALSTAVVTAARLRSDQSKNALDSFNNAVKVPNEKKLSARSRDLSIALDNFLSLRKAKEAETTQVQLDPNYVFPPPDVLVAIERSPRMRKPINISLTFVPNMTPLTAIMFAAEKHHDQHPRGRNPYDLTLEWNRKRRCHVVTQAACIHNMADRRWVVEVRSPHTKVVLSSPCLLNDKTVRLLPGAKLVVKYTKTN